MVFLVYKILLTIFEIRKLHQPGTVEKVWERLSVCFGFTAPPKTNKLSLATVKDLLSVLICTLLELSLHITRNGLSIDGPT